MVSVAKYVMGLLELLVMSNASPLQGQENLALNTLTDFGDGPLPEDKGQPLWAISLGRLDCFGLCCNR